MLHWEHSAILLTFIKLPVVIKTFVLSIFEWPFYTGFTVLVSPISEQTEGSGTALAIQSLPYFMDLNSSH